MMKALHLKNLLLASFLVTILLGSSARVLFAGDGDELSAVASVRTLYLVRHGAYHRTGDADDFTGNALIPLGIAQARLAGARLQSLPVKFDSLYSTR
jgi:hypothetical protein